MTAVIALVNLLIVIACQPWLVEPPTENLETIPVYIFDPTDLEFVLNEEESTIPWKDTESVIGIICLVCYQLILMKKEYEEIERKLEKCYEDHEKVMEIPKVYTETAKTFSELEARSKTLKVRFQNVEKNVKNTADYDNLKEDFEYVRESWKQQFNAFSVLDIDLNGVVAISDKQLKAQLVMINGLVGRELRTIEGYIREDMLSLEEVFRDVEILQKYLGK